MKYSVASSKTGSRRRIVIGIIGTIVLLLVVAFVSAWLWYQNELQPASKTSVQKTIVIPEGLGVKQIATLLEQQSIIKNARAFELYLRLNNLVGSLQAGQYALDASNSARSIAITISKGNVQKGQFTILPGQRIDQIEANMVKAGFDKAAVTDAFNADNYKNHPVLAYKPEGLSLEGYLYPETFQTTLSTKPADIVKQSLDEMADVLTPDIIDHLKQQGLTPHQGITLASIVIKEANSTEDRRMVAGVFYNRLRANTLLGSDVTYQYIADVTGQPRSADIDSPYNTRKYRGLPPGPIGTINQSALDAVANPKTSDYLYFVAGDDGTIYYAKTLAEHDALASRYCKVLCSTY